MDFKTLEEKCLYYRSLTDYRILPNSNIICMVDGRSFSKLIKNRFKKPFDDDFINIMNETAKYICKNVQGAKIAFVQSDEISILITDYDTPDSAAFFEYRLCKMQSIIASLATSKFNQLFIEYQADRNCRIAEADLAQFDCKAWCVPNANDAYAWFLYRQIDCMKNSKQQTAQTYLTYSQLLHKNADEQIELLKELNDIDWNDFPDGKKYGRFVYRIPRHLTKTLPDGNVVEFDRCSWNITDAFPIFGNEGMKNFYEIVPILKSI